MQPFLCNVDHLLLIGGSDGHSALASTQIFDLHSWSWRCGPSLRLGRMNPSVVALSTSTLAILGGYNSAMGGFLNSMEGLNIQPSTSISQTCFPYEESSDFELCDNYV